MTHFREDLKQTALKMIHELKEFMDVLNDIERAEEVHIDIGNARTQNEYDQSRRRAWVVDEELRRKYEGIQELMTIANMLPTIPSISSGNTASPKCKEQIILEQDYFGILYDTLKKKKIIETAEDFIDHVEA